MADADHLPAGHRALATPARPAALSCRQVYDAEFSEAPPRHLRDYLWVLYKYRWLAAACFGLTLGLAVPRRRC